MIFLAIALTTFLAPADPPTRFDSPRMSPFQNIENTLSVPAPGPDAIYNPLTSNVMSQDQQAQDSIALAQSVQTAEPFLLGNGPLYDNSNFNHFSESVPFPWQPVGSQTEFMEQFPVDVPHADQSLLAFDPSLASNGLPTEHFSQPQHMQARNKRLQWLEHRRQLWRTRLLPNVPCDDGLGAERIALAPWVLDTTQGNPSVGLRMRFDRGLSSPNRLEYIWARPGVGPSPERRLDLIDTSMRFEFGSRNAVAFTEVSMRSLDPEVNANTTGFGDMVVGAKGILFNNQCTQIGSVFRTVMKTGPARRGLGTGHVSLEPGLLGSHRFGRIAMLHSELKYSLPIAGSPGFSGDVLKTGIGISTLWKDWDQLARMPTLEMQTHTFLFGQQTDATGLVSSVDGKTAVDLYPGLRIAWQKPRVGIVETGFAYGMNLADSEWFDSRMIAEIRWIR